MIDFFNYVLEGNKQWLVKSCSYQHSSLEVHYIQCEQMRKRQDKDKRDRETKLVKRN